MRFFDAEQVVVGTPWAELIDAIGDALASDVAQAPSRHVHGLPPVNVDDQGGSFLLMPSWDDSLVVVKAVTYLPSNAGSDVPTVNGAVVLFRRGDGRHVATIDGDELTARRTTAIGALAARYLARADASRLLIVGTGQLAPNAARVHASMRRLTQIRIWGRNLARAEAVVEELANEGIEASVVTDLDSGVADSDIISCVTGATAPLVKGALLAPGTHLELYGSFSSEMRESDDDAITRSTIFVDTFAGALLSGDLAQPMETAIIGQDDIKSDLAGLVRGDHTGRQTKDEITLFKSAGFAVADLAAAGLIWRRAEGAKPVSAFE